MLFPIRCTCGYPIGSLYDALTERRRLVLKDALKSNNTSQENTLHAGVINADLVQIFLDYNITNLCCKSKFISSVNMYELMDKIELAGTGQSN